MKDECEKVISTKKDRKSFCIQSPIVVTCESPKTYFKLQTNLIWLCADGFLYYFNL